MLLISSRKIAPGVARPRTGRSGCRWRPVNEPLTWPNSSDSSRLSVSAPQLTRMYGPETALGLSSWMARAIELLAGPGLAYDQDGGACRRDLAGSSGRPRGSPALEPMIPGQGLVERVGAAHRGVIRGRPVSRGPAAAGGRGSITHIRLPRCRRPGTPGADGPRRWRSITAASTMMHADQPELEADHPGDVPPRVEPAGHGIRPRRTVRSRADDRSSGSRPGAARRAATPNLGSRSAPSPGVSLGAML